MTDHKCKYLVSMTDHSQSRKPEPTGTDNFQQRRTEADNTKKLHLKYAASRKYAYCLDIVTYGMLSVQFIYQAADDGKVVTLTPRKRPLKNAKFVEGKCKLIKDDEM